ncbi:MAG: redoxin domain-containing protein [Proteobacteria bacterium]|nr:redoxin domain-containing protein [Pseudomonadota bacterium]
MYFVRRALNFIDMAPYRVLRSVRYVMIFSLLIVSGCGDYFDDLHPDGGDKRPVAVPGTVGPLVGQDAKDFTISDSLGNAVTLSTETASADGVVLYFTMWCPVCDSHTSNMRSFVVTRFPNITFFLVDYVSGSVADVRSAQLSNGYADFNVLADINDVAEKGFDATMGTTVVVNSSGVIVMNEDYKDGSRLIDILETLP